MDSELTRDFGVCITQGMHVPEQWAHISVLTAEHVSPTWSALVHSHLPLPGQELPVRGYTFVH